MIYDSLNHLELYKGLSEDIYEGLKFLRGVDADMPEGVYHINPRVKAIVSTYDTKRQNENGYEAHRANPVSHQRLRKDCLSAHREVGRDQALLRRDRCGLLFFRH